MNLNYQRIQHSHFHSPPKLPRRLWQDKGQPFDQFQLDLNDWFSKALLEKGIDPENIQVNGTANLSSIPDLVSKIYHQAELLKTLSEILSK